MDEHCFGVGKLPEAFSGKVGFSRFKVSVFDVDCRKRDFLLKAAESGRHQPQKKSFDRCDMLLSCTQSREIGPEGCLIQ